MATGCQFQYSESFFIFRMWCKKLENLYGSVFPLGLAILARGFSDGLGLSHPSTSTKLANLSSFRQSFEAHQVGQVQPNYTTV
jgi:hypothetical protein